MTNTALLDFLKVFKTAIMTVLTYMGAKLQATIMGAIKYTKKGVDKQHKKEVELADEAKEAYSEIDRHSQANRDTGVDGAIERLSELSGPSKKGS